jgi:hypothetical protein
MVVSNAQVIPLETWLHTTRIQEAV